MTLSTQLRLITLAVGLVLLAIIYFLGRRRPGAERQAVSRSGGVHEPKPPVFDATASPSIDEDEFDEPSYLRRGMRRESADIVASHDSDDDSLALPSVYIDPPVANYNTDEIPAPAATMRVPVLAMQDPDRTVPMKVDAVLPSAANVDVVNQSIMAPQPTVKPIETRHLVALRMAMSEPVPGGQLLAMFQAEQLQLGKFNIFHRMHHGESIFSVASMVEPGSFDLSTMSSQSYPGISLFMLLPVSMPGLDAFESMISCAQRLAQLTSGVVQDEVGVMLLESGIERLRDKVREFERSLQG